jgi:hypothetical protein
LGASYLPPEESRSGKNLQKRTMGLISCFEFDIARYTKMKTVCRKPAAIAKTRWAAFAAAGAATALAGTNSLEAAIHYSGVLDVPFNFPRDCDESGQPLIKTFPLGQPGASFRLGRAENSYCHGIDFCNIYGLVSARFRGAKGLNNQWYVSKLGFGEEISGGHFTSNGGFFAALVTPYGGGYWTQGGGGFVGFKFNNGAGVQYGWARIRIAHHLGRAFALIDYAYADFGEAITTGQTRAGQASGDEQAADQGSLGWLALGAVGLLAWRKSRLPAAH